ncbi:MAG: 3'-5' exonuclease, partial [Oligosphaeraceae bacterium]
MDPILSSLEAVIPAPLPRIVAVEVDEDDTLELFQRSEDGEQTLSLRMPYQWWLLTAGPQMAQALELPCHWETLQGEGMHRCRVKLESRKDYDEALKRLKSLTGQSPSAPLAPYRTFSHASQQAMIDQGIRLFRGMSFAQLRRMQLDIECRSDDPARFCDARNPGDEVIMVALKDTRGLEVCLTSRDCGGEANLLRKMIQVIQEQDPDVLEGHNLFSFDLMYLKERCRRHKIPLALGRKGKVARSHPSRMNIAERTINFPRFDIYGRHVVDTYHLVMLYDVARRELESYGLKYCAKHFGLAREGRVYVNGDAITRMYEEDAGRLAEYNLDDVRETDGISQLLSPSYFYQAQLLPCSYQDCVLRGNATRIDALLCAAYLSRGCALPCPQASQTFEGALTTVENMGVFRPAWHLDVRSLYPSVLLA